MSRRVLVVPGVPALLSPYASIVDPVAELRGAVLAGLRWVVDGCSELAVVADPPGALDQQRGIRVSVGERIVTDLLDQVGFQGTTVTPVGGGLPDSPTVVVANGSACRGEKAPGHFDERSLAFDALVEEALATGSTQRLAKLDLGLGAELWCSGLTGLRALGEQQVRSVELDHASDPFGVRYWVARWVIA